MKKNLAQSTLELVAMILFIAATIFIGGPTIIRGINAHFKIWDDSVQDSYNDPLKQAPQQNLPADCVCDPPMGGPGLRCGISPCLPTERLETILCNPVGCGAALGINENYCVDDPTCCDRYLDTALCGTGGPAPDCPVGERITQRACGGGTSQFGCRVDTNPTVIDGNPTCIPHCIGTFHPNEASAASNPLLPIICPGDNSGITGGALINYVGGIGIPITLMGKTVLACSHPPSPPPDNKCETYCLQGYIPSGTGCIPNYCQVTFTVASMPPSGTNIASFTVCESEPVGGATFAGCGNPGSPGAPCVLNILPVSGGPGFQWCQVNFTVAAPGTNASFTQCEAGAIVSATITPPATCGPVGVPGSPCVLQSF